MFETNQPAFLMIPGESKARLLHPATVNEWADGKVTYVFDEAALMLKPGDEVVLYAETRGKFNQWGAQAVACSEVNGKLAWTFATVGEPVSAESRGSFRVSILTDNITATVGTFSSCPVVDVSPEGFSVLLDESIPIGSTMEASILAGKTTITGQVRVQTVKQLANGQNRYGLLAFEPRTSFRRELQKLSMDMQRMRLKRMSRAA